MKDWSRFQRYGLATIACCAALGLTRAFGEPSVWFLLAVLGSTLYGEAGPGLWAIILSISALILLVPEPHLPTFIGAALAIVVFVEAKRQADIRKRQAEETLNTRLTIDRFPGMAATLTAKGEPEFHNSQLLNYLGKTTEEMKDWPSIVHPMDLDRVMKAFAESIGTGVPLDVDHRCVCADGSYRWITNRGLSMLDREGRVVRWYILVTDIDDRKRAEEALRASELNFRMIVESIPGMIVTMTPKGEVEFANQQLLSFFGTTLEELKDWGELVHPDHRMRVAKAVLHSLETGEPYEFEHRVLRADGIYRWCHSYGQPLRDNDGRITRWNNLNTDIHDRKEAEEVLRESVAVLRQTVDSVPGLVTMGPDGGIEFANQHLLSFFGKSLEEMRDWSPNLHPDDCERVVSVWLHALETEQPFEFEFRALRADGTIRWWHSRGQPVYGNDGRIVRWINLHTDIHERREAEEVLRYTQTRLSQATQIATISELSASIAHEINQPLAAVVANGHACLRWLSNQPPDMDFAREAAERIIRDGKEAGEVASRIRALFKRAALERVSLDLNEIIDEVIRLLASETTKRRITVEADLEKSLSLVMGDRIQLQQLIFNLLLNGIEAMDSVSGSPGKLFVRSRRNGPEAIIVEIKDCGIGLENPEKIFDAFFTTKENGMGMGLAISRSIIEAHSGRLWAESEAGHGATFFFTLPTDSKVPL